MSSRQSGGPRGAGQPDQLDARDLHELLQREEAEATAANDTDSEFVFAHRLARCKRQQTFANAMQWYW
jgi:hypothetical protein